MEKAAQILEKLEVTLDKYKKNKTLVSPADLAGKYKQPFEKLKAQLKEELEILFMACVIEPLPVVSDSNGWLKEYTATVNKILSEGNAGKLIGHAAFQEYDLEKVKLILEKLQIQVYNEAWLPYFQKHICLYLTEGCLAEDNPQTPRIYNSLVDKFWDEGTGEWIKDNAAKGDAILIYMHGDKAQEGKA